MRDVAIVSFAQADKDQPEGQTETLMLLPTITRALEAVGLTRKDVGFTHIDEIPPGSAGAYRVKYELE